MDLLFVQDSFWTNLIQLIEIKHKIPSDTVFDQFIKCKKPLLISPTVIPTATRWLHEWLTTDTLNMRTFFEYYTGLTLLWI